MSNQVDDEDIYSDTPSGELVTGVKNIRQQFETPVKTPVPQSKPVVIRTASGQFKKMDGATPPTVPQKTKPASSATTAGVLPKPKPSVPAKSTASKPVSPVSPNAPPTGPFTNKKPEIRNNYSQVQKLQMPPPPVAPKKPLVTEDLSLPPPPTDLLMDVLVGVGGRRFQKVGLVPASQPPPAKPKIPTVVDIEDIRGQFALEDEDFYDDVDSFMQPDGRAVSTISEFTEEDELGSRAIEQDVYDDTMDRPLTHQTNGDMDEIYDDCNS